MSEEKSVFIPAEIGSATIEDASSELSYLNRYRLVSDTEEPLSGWSNFVFSFQNSVSSIISGYTPIYSISSVESGGVGLNIKWTVPEILERQKFDIYFAWSYDNINYTSFEYTDTVSSNNYYIEIPTVSTVLAKKVKLAVQLPTNKKIVNTNALLFETPGIDTRPVLDAGTI
jgi:hypothetical protein